MSDEIRYLAEKISKQSIEGVTWFPLTAYRKIWKERDELKKELLSKKEHELEDLESSQPMYVSKKWESLFWKEH